MGGRTEERVGGGGGRASGIRDGWAGGQAVGRRSGWTVECVGERTSGRTRVGGVISIISTNILIKNKCIFAWASPPTHSQFSNFY